MSRRRGAVRTSTKSHSKNMEEMEDEKIKETASNAVIENTNKRRNTRSTVISSKKKVNISDGMKVKKKPSLRQMSLKESFSNQETLSKRLRPRKVLRNYCENSASNKNLETQLNESKSSKVPVYKSVKLNEESSKRGSDIYDFNFDANDSKERLVAKRRGRLINRVRQKKIKRGTRAKLKLVPPVQTEKISSDIPSVNSEKKNKDNKNLESWTSTNIIKKSGGDIKKGVLPSSTNVAKTIDIDTEKEHVLVIPNGTNTLENLPGNIQSAIDSEGMRMQCDKVKNFKTNQLQSREILSENIKKQPSITVKPRIVSIENYDKDKVLVDTPVKSNLNDHVPFRKTNIFKNKASLQYGTMQNYSLINKSLSPIKKASESFDPGSPWRLSPLNTFSQVRTLFQSTPQPRQIEILKGNIKRNTKDQPRNLSESLKKNDILEKDNENINMHKTSDKSNYVSSKFGQSNRKFGTEITNLDHSVQLTNNTIAPEQSAGIASNREPKLLDVDMQNSINSVPNVSPPYNDSAEDKENTAPKRPKPKKLFRRRSKKISNTKENGIHKKETHNMQLKALNIHIPSTGMSHAQPEKEEQSKENVNSLASPGLSHIQLEKDEHSKEYFDPQPGPSGLQKNKSPSNKVLQQTNLNAFLNITEMPESTRISTAHGIFNEVHSTPIYGKPPKLINQVDTERMDVDNAFGFEEDSTEYNLDISPIYSGSENNDVKSKKVEKTDILGTRKSAALPVRLLPRAITKNIMHENADTWKDDTKNVGVKDIELKQTLPVETNKFINAVNFSDTFDILEDDNETMEEPSNVPLFKDCEPIHFTQPPKRSYKRKRNVRFSFSESGSEGDEGLDDKEPEQKKKKYGKLKKTEVKRMKEWIKSINNTFQEIDNYELTVE